MPLTYLFNPENDLALAADVDRYTAPAPIRRLRADLALLPMWIAFPGSRIIAPADDAEFLDFCKSVIDGLDGIGIYDGEPSQAMPWGWSRSVRNELLRAGVECKADDAMLSQLRRLSSRQTTVGVLQRLDAKGVDIPAMPKVCHSLAEAAAAVEEFDAAVLKMPWSSSGRGVARVDNTVFPTYENWVSGIVRRQGFVVCEPYLDKLQDFAMEFYVEGGQAAFKGYSVFFNNQQMSYDHAVVASTAELRRRLLMFVDASTLDIVQTAVTECLEELLPESYSGYVGVDMMVYRKSGGALAVNPCVEVNLRTTMGVVSSALGDNVVHSGCEGVMRVLYHKDKAALEQFKSTLQPPRFSDRRLSGGTLLLAPITSESRYTATLTIV